MKKFILLLLAVLIGVAAFIYSDPQLRNDAKGMWQRFVGATGMEKTSSKVYKWKDANGMLHYTTEPPPEGTPYEEIEARTDVNILPLPDKLKQE